MKLNKILKIAVPALLAPGIAYGAENESNKKLYTETADTADAITRVFTPEVKNSELPAETRKILQENIDNRDINNPFPGFYSSLVLANPAVFGEEIKKYINNPDEYLGYIQGIYESTKHYYLKEKAWLMDNGNDASLYELTNSDEQNIMLLALENIYSNNAIAKKVISYLQILETTGDIDENGTINDPSKRTSHMGLSTCNDDIQDCSDVPVFVPDGIFSSAHKLMKKLDFAEKYESAKQGNILNIDQISLYSEKEFFAVLVHLAEQGVDLTAEIQSRYDNAPGESKVEKRESAIQEFFVDYRYKMGEKNIIEQTDKIHDEGISLSVSMQEYLSGKPGDISLTRGDPLIFEKTENGFSINGNVVTESNFSAALPGGGCYGKDSPHSCESVGAAIVGEQVIDANSLNTIQITPDKITEWIPTETGLSLGVETGKIEQGNMDVSFYNEATGEFITVQVTNGETVTVYVYTRKAPEKERKDSLFAFKGAVSSTLSNGAKETISLLAQLSDNDEKDKIGIGYKLQQRLIGDLSVYAQATVYSKGEADVSFGVSTPLFKEGPFLRQISAEFTPEDLRRISVELLRFKYKQISTSLSANINKNGDIAGFSVPFGYEQPIDEVAQAIDDAIENLVKSSEFAKKYEGRTTDMSSEQKDAYLRDMAEIFVFNSLHNSKIVPNIDKHSISLAFSFDNLKKLLALDPTAVIPGYGYSSLNTQFYGDSSRASEHEPFSTSSVTPEILETGESALNIPALQDSLVKTTASLSGLELKGINFPVDVEYRVENGKFILQEGFAFDNISYSVDKTWRNYSIDIRVKTQEAIPERKTGNIVLPESHDFKDYKKLAEDVKKSLLTNADAIEKAVLEVGVIEKFSTLEKEWKAKYKILKERGLMMKELEELYNMDIPAANKLSILKLAVLPLIEERTKSFREDRKAIGKGQNPQDVTADKRLEQAENNNVVGKAVASEWEGNAADALDAIGQMKKDTDNSFHPFACETACEMLMVAQNGKVDRFVFVPREIINIIGKAVTINGIAYVQVPWCGGNFSAVRPIQESEYEHNPQPISATVQPVSTKVLAQIERETRLIQASLLFPVDTKTQTVTVVEKKITTGKKTTIHTLGYQNSGMFTIEGGKGEFEVARMPTLEEIRWFLSQIGINADTLDSEDTGVLQEMYVELITAYTTDLNNGILHEHGSLEGTEKNSEFFAAYARISAEVIQKYGTKGVTVTGQFYTVDENGNPTGWAAEKIQNVLDAENAIPEADVAYLKKSKNQEDFEARMKALVERDKNPWTEGPSITTATSGSTTEIFTDNVERLQNFAAEATDQPFAAQLQNHVNVAKENKSKVQQWMVNGKVVKPNEGWEKAGETEKIFVDRPNN